MRFLHSLIIPYQELLGNYDESWPDNQMRKIIPYQELLGNYDSEAVPNAKALDYTIPRAIREL